MRKSILILLAGLVASMLAAFGPQAAAADDPYASITTGCHVDVVNNKYQGRGGVMKVGKKAKIKVRVSAGGLNAMGTVNVEVRRKGALVFSASRDYAGKTQTVRTQNLRKLGTYVVNMAFTHDSSTNFGDCSKSTSFKVVKKKPKRR